MGANNTFGKNASRVTSNIHINNIESILDSVPALIAYVNKDMRYRFMNQAYEVWFGISRTTAIGKTIKEVLGERAFDNLKVHLEKVLEGSEVNFIIDMPFSSGERTVDATYTPDFDEGGKVIGFTSLVKDITEKRKIEKEQEFSRKREAERRTEERYLKMIEAITDYAIIFLNKEGTVENWNKGAENIKGYKKEEVIGKHIRIFYGKEDQDKKLPESMLQAAREHGKAVQEGWRKRNDSSFFWASVTITSLYDDNKNISGFTKVTRDLTERKLAEDQLRQYAIQLEYQNKELEQFAYIASHDLQEPLRKIKTFNTRILETEHLSDPAKDYFNRSISAANRMQRLIDDLLSYSRTSSDSKNFKTVNLNTTLKEILTTRRDALEEYKFAIEAQELPVIQAIPFQMWQLLDNLVSNAIKYRKVEGTPTIKISSERVFGEFFHDKEIDSANEYYRIRVSDNGIGFEPEYNEKIFEIFQRLHGHGTLPGSGIGLAICKKIINNHRGFISAHGLPNKGATFDVYLPV